MMLSPRKPPSSFGGNILLYAGCCAVAAWMFWPMIRDALPPGFSPPSGNHTGVTPWRPGMKLDPTRTDDIEDRRNERRGGGGLGRDLGGNDIGRGGPPPWGRDRRGVPPWGDDDAGMGPPPWARRAERLPPMEGPETSGSARGDGWPRTGPRHRFCTGPWWDFTDGPRCGPWVEGR